jgi:hypothetical protein
LYIENEDDDVDSKLNTLVSTLALRLGDEETKNVNEKRSRSDFYSNNSQSTKKRKKNGSKTKKKKVEYVETIDNGTQSDQEEEIDTINKGDESKNQIDESINIHIHIHI